MKQILIIIALLFSYISANASLEYYNKNSFIETEFLDVKSCEEISKSQYICPKWYEKKYPDAIIDEMKKRIEDYDLKEDDYESISKYNKMVADYKKIIKETQDDINKNCVTQEKYCMAFTCKDTKPGTVYYKENNSCLCENWNPYDNENKTCLKPIAYKNSLCVKEKFWSYYSASEEKCLCENGNNFEEWCTNPFIEMKYVYMLGWLVWLFILIIIIQYIIRKRKKEV